jgi:hypothetical protein
MFHRNIVIGKDSKIHKRAMKPDPDFGSHPLLSRAAASFFLTTNSETASELALSPDQTQAREEWREGADQRNADWANIWDQSVLTKGQSGGSETVDRKVPQQGIEDSDAESEANDGEHADLPEGVATEIPLTAYLGDLELKDKTTAEGPDTAA